MGIALDKVLDVYASAKIPDPKDDELAMLKDGVRARIIEEVCTEEVERITAARREQEISDKAKTYGSQVSKLVLEAVVLAVVIGLFVNDSFEWLVHSVLMVENGVDLGRVAIAWWVLLVIIGLIVLFILFKGAASIVRSFNEIKRDIK